jgi:hypothetical protein
MVHQTIQLPNIHSTNQSTIPYHPTSLRTPAPPHCPRLRTPRVLGQSFHHKIRTSAIPRNTFPRLPTMASIRSWDMHQLKPPLRYKADSPMKASTRSAPRNPVRTAARSPTTGLPARSLARAATAIAIGLRSVLSAHLHFMYRLTSRDRDCGEEQRNVVGEGIDTRLRCVFSVRERFVYRQVLGLDLKWRNALASKLQRIHHKLQN